MKKFIWAVPLAILPLAGSLGCAPAPEESNPDKMLISRADEDKAADAKTSEAKASDEKTETGADASTQQKAEETASSSSDSSSSGDSSPSGGKTYQVAEEGNPSMSAEALKYLKNATLPPPPADFKVAGKQQVKLATSKGDIVVELDAKAAPLHAKSFAYLTSKKFYDGIVIHRYEPGFVIQAGDPLTKNSKYEDWFGQGGPGYTIPREYNSLKHDQFVLSMARTNDPDSGGSQFFITLAPTPFLDQEGSQDGVGYTVFGKVVKGSDVVMKIRAGDKIKSATLLK